MRSLAIDACPDPDVIDVQALPLPPGLPTDPAWWLRELFAFGSAPWPVKALMGVRQLVAGIVGASTHRTGPDVFAQDAADDREVMAHESDTHLDFWAGVAVDDGLFQVTTVVTLHGWRGRLYWAPVGALHAPILRSMMRRTIARAVAGTATR
ncbi:DUF2867 domain-containing protein [Antribacter gilvus]|uniref:DUF2867 domain-containing protein n=1 Tax=Antribacter gilvus TaxID=2304675 RepID=UPI000F79FBA6|nr:DUF2867 domain-containing protein [Antribacter gilvus]